MASKYHDRFTKASKELDDKNAYECRTCGSTDIRRVEKPAEGRKKGVKDEEENVSLHIARSKAEKAIYDDPSPLGP